MVLGADACHPSIRERLHLARPTDVRLIDDRTGVVKPQPAVCRGRRDPVGPAPVRSVARRCAIQRLGSRCPARPRVNHRLGRDALGERARDEASRLGVDTGWLATTDRVPTGLR